MRACHAARGERRSSPASCNRQAPAADRRRPVVPSTHRSSEHRRGPSGGADGVPQGFPTRRTAATQLGTVTASQFTPCSRPLVDPEGDEVTLPPDRVWPEGGRDGDEGRRRDGGHRRHPPTEQMVGPARRADAAASPRRPPEEGDAGAGEGQREEERGELCHPAEPQRRTEPERRTPAQTLAQAGGRESGGRGRGSADRRRAPGCQEGSSTVGGQEGTRQRCLQPDVPAARRGDTQRPRRGRRRAVRAAARLQVGRAHGIATDRVPLGVVAEVPEAVGGEVPALEEERHADQVGAEEGLAAEEVTGPSGRDERIGQAAEVESTVQPAALVAVNGPGREGREIPPMDDAEQHTGDPASRLTPGRPPSRVRRRSAGATRRGTRPRWRGRRPLAP